MLYEAGAVIEDRYQLLNGLAGSATCEIYEARDARLARPVVLRVLRPELAADARIVERFRRCARVAVGLHSPKIVTVFDYGVDGDACFLSTEHLEGRTLADELAEPGIFPIDQAVDYALDIAEALAAAHAVGLIHGGLEPSRVMLTAGGTAKVAEFGTTLAVLRHASDTEGHTSDSTGDGSNVAVSMFENASYVSPEQVGGAAPDTRSDLYNLGLLFSEMITGEKVFVGADSLDTARRQVEDPPRAPSYLVAPLPFGCDTIVLHLLAKDPADRYASAGALVADLRGLRETIRPLSETPAGGHLSPSKPSFVPSLLPLVADATMAVERLSETDGPAERASTSVDAADRTDAEIDAVPDEVSGSRVMGWAFAVAAAAIVAVMVALVVVALNSDNAVTPRPKPAVPTTQKSGSQVVPSVTETTEDVARARLIARGFEVTTVRVSNFNALDGWVFDQSPAAGERVDKGSVVTLTVSSGIPTTTTSPPETTMPPAFPTPEATTTTTSPGQTPTATTTPTATAVTPAPPT